MHYSIAVTVPAGEDVNGWLDGNLPEHEGKHWGWYEVGGRWENYWATKSGEKTNATWVSEIDWEGMVAEQITKAKEAYDGNSKWIPRERYTREEYINLCRNVATYGWITKENEWVDRWYEDDEVNSKEWEKQFRKYITSLDPDDVLVLVDFHN